MANSYYQHTDGVPLSQSRLASAQIRNEFDLVAAGFDTLPPAARMFTNSSGFVNDTGGANAFFLTGIPGVAAYLDGMEVLFRAANTVTGAATINVNGLGIKSVRRTDGTPIAAGDIVGGQIVSMRYSSQTGGFQFFSSSNAAAAGSAAASAASAVQSKDFRDQAQTYSQSAMTYRDTTAGYRDAAAASASAAGTARNEAQAFRNQAEQFKNDASSAAGGGITSINGVSGPGAVTLSFGQLTGKPTTILGYGITDMAQQVAAYPPQGHGHPSAAISNFASSVLALAMPARPMYYANAVTTNIGDADQIIKAVWGAQQNLVLPISGTENRTIEIIVANNRADVAVYVPAGQLMVIGSQVLSGGDYVLLNLIPNSSHVFKWLDSDRQWRLVS